MTWIIQWRSHFGLEDQSVQNDTAMISATLVQPWV
jgi:hypothetical protein